MNFCKNIYIYWTNNICKSIYYPNHSTIFKYAASDKYTHWLGDLHRSGPLLDLWAIPGMIFLQISRSPKIPSSYQFLGTYVTLIFTCRSLTKSSFQIIALMWQVFMGALCNSRKIRRALQKQWHFSPTWRARLMKRINLSMWVSDEMNQRKHGQIMKLWHLFRKKKLLIV